MSSQFSFLFHESLLFHDFSSFKALIFSPTLSCLVLIEIPENNFSPYLRVQLIHPISKDYVSQRMNNIGTKQCLLFMTEPRCSHIQSSYGHLFRTKLINTAPTIVEGLLTDDGC